MTIKKEVGGEIEFFLNVIKLKKIGRRGWNLRGVETPETVADHSFGTALLALYYGKKFGLDVEKLVGLALVHDLNEIETGELVKDKFKPIGLKEKMKKGEKAISKIVSPLPFLKKEIVNMWKEENSRATPEASFARDLNKLEMGFQALYYELNGLPSERLDDVWEYLEENVRDKRIKTVLQELQKRRPVRKGK